jgi:hypothetical protein
MAALPALRLAALARGSASWTARHAVGALATRRALSAAARASGAAYAPHRARDDAPVLGELAIPLPTVTLLDRAFGAPGKAGERGKGLRSSTAAHPARARMARTAEKRVALAVRSLRSSMGRAVLVRTNGCGMRCMLSAQ